MSNMGNIVTDGMRNVDGLLSFCVTTSFVVTIESGNRKLPRYFDKSVNYDDDSQSSDTLGDPDIYYVPADITLSPPECPENVKMSGCPENVSSINVFQMETGEFMFSISLRRVVIGPY